MKPLSHPPLDTVFGAATTRTTEFTRHLFRWPAIGLIAAAIGGLFAAPSGRGEHDQLRAVFDAPNGSGRVRTINAAGFPVVAVDNPFFLDLGANGRRCVTCHQPAENMSVSPPGIQARFDATDGDDPIFRPNDGSNSPLADISTVDARRAAYSMLLTKGLIRVGL